MLRRAAFPVDSHDEKALLEILESYPRDELFQISEDDLYRIAMGILHLGARQRVRLFTRRDTFDRFVSCLVFVPRDRFNTENRRRIEGILRRATGAISIDYSTHVSESVLVRLHYLAYVEPGTLPDLDERQTETLLVAATRSWGDDLEEALLDEYGEERGAALFRRYGEAFPAAYRADWVPRSALADIARIEELDEGDDLSLRLYRPLEAPQGALRAKVFRAGPPLALSDMLPLFEDMGVEVADERPYAIAPRDREDVWIYDFGLTYAGADELETERVRDTFQDAFIRAWRGDTESDGYNRLVLRAGLTSREATVLRAIGRYLRQAGTTFSDRYVEQALVAHPEVARLLVDLVLARFDPQAPDAERAERLSASIAEEIDAVESLDQDRILRNFLDVVRAMLRTNFFQRDGGRLAQDLPVLQARPRAARMAAAAAAALRDLRLLAAHRGRAPARRQGRARRAALVGSPRGLPHRGARPDEGADGQERGDRAGGGKGRLRGQAPAAGGRPRRAAGRGRSLLPDLHLRPARPHRQHRRQRDRAAAGRRALRRGRPVPRGRGGQGDGDALGRGQRASPTTTASGSATRSPRAARAATTTSRWGSPRAARGSPSSAISASSGATCRSRTSRSSASATCRATCSATACCCRSTSG